MLTFLRKIAFRISARARRRRADLFRSLFELGPETTILDLGSQDGSHLKSVLESTSVRIENVMAADIDEDAIKRIAETHGFRPILVVEDGSIPLPNQSVDIVFCSSVIEHVTVDKEDVWNVTGDREFREKAFVRQTGFANEIRRVGKGFFVQTPNRYFPIESHTWLPFVAYLPRPWMIAAIKLANKYWIHYSVPDYNLLGKAEMQKLFPEADLIFERSFGLVKSIMAVKGGSNSGKENEI